LYPHDIYPPGIDLEFDDEGNFDHDSPEALKWFLEEYRYLPTDQKKRPIECILEAGEMIFVPSGWWHQVLNLEESIAITQNYCNEHNFEIVCSEIYFDDEDFYDGFKERMALKRPNIKFPKKLQKSGFRTG
jgi:oxalate decarboxylase/phosphoglucose isomerase-like protein (cupin superfamily)